MPKRTLAKRFLTSTEKWLKPILQQLKEHLLKEELLHADETYYRVLSSDKQKTYYWLFRTIEQATYPIVLFQHDLTRSSSVPQTFLHGFKGFLHCDAYSTYGTLANVTLVNCWATYEESSFRQKGLTLSSLKQPKVSNSAMSFLRLSERSNSFHQMKSTELEMSNPNRF